MIRVAAVGDLHLGPDSAALWSEGFARVSDEADLLLLAGDLTRCGSREEAEEVARVLREVEVPTVAVLGSHDYHSDRPREMTRVLERVGVHVLEGSSVVLPDGQGPRRRGGHQGVRGRLRRGLRRRLRRGPR